MPPRFTSQVATGSAKERPTDAAPARWNRRSGAGGAQHGGDARGVAELGRVRRDARRDRFLPARAHQGVDLVPEAEAVGAQVTPGEPGGAGDEHPHER